MMKKRLFVFAALVPVFCFAQLSTSKIVQVQVYPGGAKVERVATVVGGAREIKLSCLTSRFDIDSLQVQADAGVQIGDISVQTLDRTRAPECANSPLDSRIRELVDQKAAISAESEAQDLVLGYLKNYGNDKQGGVNPIGAMAEQLRRTGQDAVQRKYNAQRRIEEIEKQLVPLLADRDRITSANPQVRTVQIRLAAQTDGELRVSYRLRQAGWTPIYRAYLDTNKAVLRLERLAQVAQTTGEDWSNVNLRLSTSQPNGANRINPLYPWTLDIRQPVKVSNIVQDSRPISAPQYVSAPKSVQVTGSRIVSSEEENIPRFDVSVFQGEYATEFVVPGKINLSSDGQRVGFALGNQLLDAKVLVRVQPQQESRAYLLVDAVRPTGSWPNGEVQLFRDGDFVGNSQLRLGNEERLEMFYGNDEMVSVITEPELRDSAERGFIGSRAEQKIGHAFNIENRHKKAVTLQVLEASPVARNEEIRVQAKFNPKPTQEAWRKQPGIIEWQLPLEAGKTIRLTADYLINYPKEAIIDGWR